MCACAACSLHTVCVGTPNSVTCQRRSPVCCDRRACCPPPDSDVVWPRIASRQCPIVTFALPTASTTLPVPVAQALPTGPPLVPCMASLPMKCWLAQWPSCPRSRPRQEPCSGTCATPPGGPRPAGTGEAAEEAAPARPGTAATCLSMEELLAQVPDEAMDSSARARLRDVLEAERDRCEVAGGMRLLLSSLITRRASWSHRASTQSLG